jgi:antitoxin PrlF
VSFRGPISPERSVATRSGDTELLTRSVSRLSGARRSAGNRAGEITQLFVHDMSEPALLRHIRSMRITSKGQVTIPHAIRDALGLLPNTEVTFDVVDGEARIRKATGKSKEFSRGDGVLAHLRSIGPSNKLTTDEIMSLMRGKP